jgi:ribosomal protection tetracycline resistance protein
VQTRISGQTPISGQTLNLGILAHVDAGKTSLTERLLHAAGVIDEIGSVDDGSTQTDSLALERARGITIKSAVATFDVDGVTVNLIDTPGHPDFIAEVERALRVLDGAVLVVSAVEGVPAQTRVLMRTLRRLGLPTLVFVNKIDRMGARPSALLDELSDKLGVAVVPMGEPVDVGSRSASVVPLSGAEWWPGWGEVLAEHDEALLEAYVDDATPLPGADLLAALVAQSRAGRVHPVFFGSAITGAGVDALLSGLVGLLPTGRGDAGGPVSGTVFKVERGPAGEKLAYVRLFSGTVRTRDVLTVGPAAVEAKVTAVQLFEGGTAVTVPSASAGQIARLTGLAAVRVGDPVGVPRASSGQVFAPPTLESVVLPRRHTERTALHTALAQLAEQDPLINLRVDPVRAEIAVSLYGEVQKEVVEATLADEFGLAVDFRETTTICIERPVGSGAAVELIDVAPNPFLATVGLRVEPAPHGTGNSFGLEVELGSMPYSFFRAVEDTVEETLHQGLHGWEVTDCRVTMTRCGYWPRQSAMHAGFDKSMSSTAGDFRNLTPLVLMAALAEAGTEVLEPWHRFRLEVPADTLGPLLPAVSRLGAVPLDTVARGSSYVVEGDVPAAMLHALTRALPGLTHGEGVLESAFDRYAPVRGRTPSRPRSDHNPLDRVAYLRRVQRRAVDPARGPG